MIAKYGTKFHTQFSVVGVCLDVCVQCFTCF